MTSLSVQSKQIKLKILVIGSKPHRRVQYVDWLEPFPNIEEFDCLIINMQSLDQSTFDKLEKRKVDTMRSSIGVSYAQS